MSLPVAITTCVLSVGPFLNAEGDPLAVSMKVTPRFGTGVDFLTWTATGDNITSSVMTGTVASDGSASVRVPVVDQTGWTDPSATNYTLWRYEVAWTVDGKTLSKNIQPLTGQTSIDVDKVASGPTGSPVSTPLAYVTAVGGFTGDVSVAELNSLGLGGGSGGVSSWAGLQAASDFPAFVAFGATALGARTAIGAGTSSLALGTTSTSAAAGNDGRLSDARTPLTHTHTASQISDSTTTGRGVLTAANAGAARAVIGAMAYLVDPTDTTGVADGTLIAYTT